jgi:phytoene dehydrogenase-like protein
MNPLPSYPLSEASPALIAQYDTISAATFLARFGSTWLSRTMDLYCRSVLGSSSSEVNAYSLLNFYSYDFGDEFGIPCFTVQGGMQRIAAAAANTLGRNGVDIIPDALVSSVESPLGDAPAQIRYVQRGSAQRTLLADSVIVATPKWISSRVVIDLPLEQRLAMQSVRHAPYVTMALWCSSPLSDESAFDYWIFDDKHRLTDVLDATSQTLGGSTSRASSLSATENKHRYIAFIPCPSTSAGHLGTPAGVEKVARSGLSALAKVSPSCRKSILAARAFAWTPGVVVPYVGSSTNLHATISAPFRKVLFANTDNDLAPSLENGFDHGVRAAEFVLSTMKRSR